MSYFETTQQAQRVFEELFTVLSEDSAAMDKMESSGLKVEIIHKKPDCRIQFDGQGIHSLDEQFTPNVRIAMNCDTAHKLWMGELLMPVALATGRVRVKGNVPKILELIPVLQPAFDRYEEVAVKHGVI